MAAAARTDLRAAPARGRLRRARRCAGQVSNPRRRSGQPSVPGGRRRVFAPGPRRAVGVLSAALGLPDRGVPRAGPRAAGGSSRPGAEPRRHRRARLDGPGCRAPVSGLASGWRVRRVRRLVRRRRLRQVPGQRRHRAVAAAAPRRTADRRARPMATSLVDMPLGARLDDAHAGADRPPARGHGLPPRARHRMVADPRVAARGPDGPGAAPAVDRCHAAPGRHRRPRVPGCSRDAIATTRLDCLLRRGSRTAPRTPNPPWSRPTTRVATAVARTATRMSATTSTGQRPNCGWPRGSRRFATKSAPRRSTRARPSRPTASTSTAWRRRRELRPCGVPRPGSAARPRAWSRPPSDCVRCRPRQPWGQPYAPPDGWDWGSNGRILNNLVVLAAAHAHTGDRVSGTASSRGSTTCSAATRSGTATSSGTAPTTRGICAPASSDTTWTRRFPPPPRGALAGGANSNRRPDSRATRGSLGCHRSSCYLDEPTSETTNDLCIRWNAPLAFVTAYVDLT